ncbi:MAG: hypothetical protein HeimC3_49060 [Candidatus Heimdallarchaeota archaeon LC_3]|nr:MAG: hypothetical protein HeimC3_49060 [Candidatus Heimdallarchaeota archaeon LC_3]
MVIVDTEFLFGLRQEDKNYRQCRGIVEKKSQSLEIPGIALLEVILVMMSQQKTFAQILGFLEALLELNTLYSIKEKKMGLKELIEGIKTLESDPSISLFDGLIIGAARMDGKDILGNDPIYQELQDIKGWRFTDYLKKF